MTMNVFELRQYTTVPGRRDELIDHFERWFVDSQDAVGARVLGRFRDCDDPDRFVWMRGFPSMEARLAALTTFYDGPVWKAHRAPAVATMRDTDNVLLLRSLPGEDGWPSAAESGPLLVLLHDLRDVDPARFGEHFRGAGHDFLAANGATAVRLLVTERAPDLFTRHPIRLGESVAACFARFAEQAVLDACVAAWSLAQPLRRAAPDVLLPAFMRRPEVLRLASTADQPMR